MAPEQRINLSDTIRDLESLVESYKTEKPKKIVTRSSGPCDAIDAAVTQQQQVVDAAADTLLLEQLTLMILQMQQMMCHSQN